MLEFCLCRLGNVVFWRLARLQEDLRWSVVYSHFTEELTLCSNPSDLRTRERLKIKAHYQNEVNVIIQSFLKLNYEI